MPLVAWRYKKSVVNLLSLYVGGSTVVAGVCTWTSRKRAMTSTSSSASSGGWSARCVTDSASRRRNGGRRHRRPCPTTLSTRRMSSLSSSRARSVTDAPSRFWLLGSNVVTAPNATRTASTRWSNQRMPTSAGSAPRRANSRTRPSARTTLCAKNSSISQPSVSGNSSIF